MAYHTIDELQPARLTEAELVQLTNDEVGATTIDTDVYEGVRDDAEAEIDAYLGARYSLPLDSTPAVVKRLSITITVYYLYARRFAGGVPEQIRKSYEDAVALLRRLSDGTATLGVQPAPTQNSERLAEVSGQTAVFTRTSLKSF